MANYKNILKININNGKKEKIIAKILYTFLACTEIQHLDDDFSDLAIAFKNKDELERFLPRLVNMFDVSVVDLHLHLSLNGQKR